jgi:hypothetical protein
MKVTLPAGLETPCVTVTVAVMASVPPAIPGSGFDFTAVAVVA